MAVTNFSPEEKARDLLMHLNSSDLHYSAQVFPFSLYISVRKKLKTSNIVIQDQTSHQLSYINMPSETLYALKSDFENELKQKALEYNELKVEKELLEEKLENMKDSIDDIKTEIAEKSLQSH
jgi:hypothetical protein